MQGYYVSMVVQGKRTQQSPQSYFTSSLTLIEETSFNPNCTDTLQLKDYVFHAGIIVLGPQKINCALQSTVV